MSQKEAYDEASKTTPIEGEVVVSGPDGVAVSLTPRAARVTGERLARTASEAESQEAAPPSAGHGVNMEDQVGEALIAELQRQAADSDGRLTVSVEGDDRVRIEGAVDIGALAMVAVGALAGGPWDPVQTQRSSVRRALQVRFIFDRAKHRDAPVRRR